MRQFLHGESSSSGGLVVCTKPDSRFYYPIVHIIIALFLVYFWLVILSDILGTMIEWESLFDQPAYRNEVAAFLNTAYFRGG